MDTLIQHIDNIFSVLPQTKDIKLLKEIIMEELNTSYDELILNGYTSNQATSLLLAKYDSIEDVFEMKGLDVENQPTDSYTLKLDEILSYITLKKHSTSLFCIGLSFILFSFPCFSLTKTILMPNTLSTLDANTPCIPALLLLLCFISIGLFIICLSQACLVDCPLTKHPHFTLSERSRKYLKSNYATYPLILSNTIGILLCLIALLILFNMPINHSFFYYCHFFSFSLLVTCACTIFVMCSSICSTYQKLLILDMNH